MKVLEVTAEHYQREILKPFTVFDSAAFSLAHLPKCDTVHFFLFKTNKLKFGLIGGVVNGVFKCPFSAPYGGLTPLRDDIRLVDYHAAVAGLLAVLSETVTQVEITLPPLIYGENHLSNSLNALTAHGFAIAYSDLNYHFNLTYFDGYVECLIHKSRQRLNNALNLGTLAFAKCTELSEYQQAYQVLQENRHNKDRALQLSLDAIVQLMPTIAIDIYWVRNAELAVAAAICYHVSADIVQVVYWGDLPGHEALNSVSYLAYQLFNIYHQQGKKIVDIGPSSKEGVANFGLCEFKRSIGCDVSLKMHLVKQLA